MKQGLSMGACHCFAVSPRAIGFADRAASRLVPTGNARMARRVA